MNELVGASTKASLTRSFLLKNILREIIILSLGLLV